MLLLTREDLGEATFTSAPGDRVAGWWVWRGREVEDNGGVSVHVGKTYISAPMIVPNIRISSSSGWGGWWGPKLGRGLRGQLPDLGLLFSLSPTTIPIQTPNSSWVGDAFCSWETEPAEAGWRQQLWGGVCGDGGEPGGRPRLLPWLYRLERPAGNNIVKLTHIT